MSQPRGLSVVALLAVGASLSISCTSGDSATLALDPLQGSEGEAGADGGTDEAPGEGDGSCDAECGESEPVCDEGDCVECTDASHCVEGEACDPVDRECSESCESDAECEGEICHPSGYCSECASSSDCGVEEGALCSPEGECVECLNDTHCDEPGESFCLVDEGECVGCIEDSGCDSGICDKEAGECVE